MASREVVIPGDLLADDPRQAGQGTYVQDGRVFSYHYGLVDKNDKIRVIPLKGQYIPRRHDLVIGKVIDITTANWIIDINSPYDGLLHVSEVPDRIESREMSSYLGMGVSALFSVVDVSQSMKVELSLKDRECRSLRTGRLVEIHHTKIPRVIGRGGSMISMIKKELGVDIQVGKNGCIWLDGDNDYVDIAVEAIQTIEREAHTFGLTDRSKEFIIEEKKRVEQTLSELNVTVEPADLLREVSLFADRSDISEEIVVLSFGEMTIAISKAVGW